jgi:hypothetical protein
MRISLFPVKNKSSRQRTPELAQTGERPLLASITANLENPLAGDANLDLVAFLEIERVDHGRGEPIAPF